MTDASLGHHAQTPRPTLTGNHVRLEPLRVDHAAELWPAVDDPTIAQYWPRRWTNQQDVERQFEALTNTAATTPYLVRNARTGAAAGSTAFYNISTEHLHLSIGWTFYNQAHRRTATNTETKLLLLTEAFETCRMERVQFDVDGRNTRSQEAVLRLGANLDGILRRHRVLHDGYIRDTHVFSILREEWPAAKARLQKRLDGPADFEA